MNISIKKGTFFIFSFFSAYYLYYVWIPSGINCISNPNDTYTHIIVGAGTAGCVLASRLSENSRNRILLIEAGGHFNLLSKIPFLAVFLQKSNYDWRYETESQKWSSAGFYNKKQALPRGKGLGGSNQINLLIYNGIDGEPTWELQDKLTDFVRAKKCLKQSRYFEYIFLTKLKVCTIKCKKYFTFWVQRSTSELGDILKRSLRELNLSSTEYYRGDASIYKGERWSTYRSHLLPVSNRKNLHILCNTEVNKIIFKGKLAIGVQLDNNHKIYGKSEIIISAGSINTPKLLLLSGIGDKQKLQELNITQIHNLPGVGENLHDHIAVPIYVEIKKPLSLTLSKIFSPSHLFKYATKKTGIFASSPMTAFLKTPNNFLIMFTGSTPENPFRTISNYLPETFRNVFPFANDYSREGFVFLAGCKNTQSRGFVKLNADNSLIVDPQYLQKEEDIECVKNAMFLTYEILNASHFKSIGVKVHYPELPLCSNKNLTRHAYLECIIRIAALTTYHQGGTCKMGDDALSVVDKKFRVQGVRSLRIVDASVLATPSNNFPNTIITVMAEYASSLLADIK